MTAHPQAVAAAAEALGLIPGTTVVYPQSVAATVVAAAAPHIERAIREQVAADIEAEWQEVCGGYRNLDVCESCRGYDDAARIARGGAA